MAEQKFRNLLKDKPVLILLLLILAAGIFVRVYDYDEVGMWNDDTTTIPTGLLWFYEHDYYPGLAGQGEPALGNLLVGAGCMLSGEDFSNIEQIIPMYYPSRERLLGGTIPKAMPYCRIPGVLFGIILLFLVALLSLILFDKYVALFTTAFYAFYPPLIQLSTFIHVDIFSYVFIAASLIALYLFYIEEKGSTKERIWFATAALFASMAFCTKLPNAAYIVFAFLVLAEKNIEAIKTWLGKTLNLSFIKKDGEINLTPLTENLLTGLGVAAATIFIAFEYSFKNVIEVIKKYRADSNTELATLGFNTDFLTYIHNFFFHANVLDILLLLFSLYVIIKLIANFKALHKNEKFLLYLYGMFIAINLAVETFKITRVMLMFVFPVIITMGLSLSSRFSPIPKTSKRQVALAFVLIYLIAGLSIAFSISPHFESCNTLLKHVTPEKCVQSYTFEATKQIAEKIDSVMADNETFVNMEGIIFYYTRHDQGEQTFPVRQALRQQLGREPTIEEKINYFQPILNRTIRYVLMAPGKHDDDPMLKNLMLNYEPNEVAYLKKWPAANIYDLKNLRNKT